MQGVNPILKHFHDWQCENESTTLCCLWVGVSGITICPFRFSILAVTFQLCATGLMLTRVVVKTLSFWSRYVMRSMQLELVYRVCAARTGLFHILSSLDCMIQSNNAFTG